MPTIHDEKGFRFWFGSRGERNEPPHVHVTKDRKTAKFWLNPIELADGGRFQRHEISVIARIVQAHRQAFLERWNEHFNQ